MTLPDDDSLCDVFARARDRAARLASWIAQLRAGDRAFAEASAVRPDDITESQAAVYLLAGHELIWSTIGPSVLTERSIGPVIGELQRPRRPWTSTDDTVMASAAHLCDVDRFTATFPYRFGEPYFARWVTAWHLRRRSHPHRPRSGPPMSVHTPISA
jgi:hypothetical protein